MAWYRPRTATDKFFAISLIIKGVTGLFEFAGGLALLLISSSTVHHLLNFANNRTIAAHPHNPITYLLLQASYTFGGASKWFAVAYLWVHAAIKLTAVIGILRNQLWAYPFGLVTLVLLMIYQIYSISVRVSVGLIILTIFDAIVLWLIWVEYGKMRARHAEQRRNHHK